MKKIAALLSAIAFLGHTGPLFAQESSDSENLDELFESEDTGVVNVPAESQTQADELLLKNDAGVKWGGSFNSTMGWAGGWKKWPETGDLTRNWFDSLNLALKASWFFDGRPEKNFRVFGKFQTTYPLSTTIKYLQDPTSAYNMITNPANSLIIPNIKIWELFSDFNIEERLFFRVGKQVAAWGTSRFYSPGDVISLTAKDPEDPTAEREGPLALKVTMPFSGANLFGYVLAKEDYFPAGSTATFRELGYGLKGDLVVGNAELSAGGFYQAELAPKGVATINTSIGDFQVFSENVVAYGSDKKLLDLTNLSAAKDKANWYYSGTVGALYQNTDWNFMFYGEYFFNGQGSANATYSEKALAALKLGLIGYNDLFNPGQQNASASISFSKIAETKFGLSVLWQGNFSDQSGWVIPTLSWEPWDYFKVSAGFRTAYGGDNTEFPFKNGSRVSLFVNGILGSGKF